MTLYSLINDARERLRLFSDDSGVSDEHIKYLINNTRAKFIKQYLNDVKKKIPQAIRQQIQLNLESNPTQGFSASKFLRSVEEVPRLITTQSSYNRDVLSSDNELIRTFTMTSYKRLPYIGTRRGLNSVVYGAIGDNDKLYLTSGDDKIVFLSDVKMYGVFEDPEAAWMLSMEYDPLVDYEEVEYPLEPSMASLVVEDIIKQLAIRFEILEDKVNDGKEES